jgi:tetratricopeptide (TPR) repeat protein
MTRGAYDEAVARFLCHRRDALAFARAAAREAPGRAAPHLLEAFLLLCSRDRRDFRSASTALERSRNLKKDAVEVAHEAAVDAAVGGNYERAIGILDARLTQCPQDAVALGVAHVFDYFLGNAGSLRSRSARVLAAWPEDLPHYHAVLSMHAFALQECGEYDAAEAAARRAAGLEPRDLRAWHALTHVLEMQGRAGEGLGWLAAGEPLWTGEGAAATHLWWHRALLHLQLGDVSAALALYDRRIAGGWLAELIDASGLLWRLHLQEVDVRDRFHALALRWAPHAEDGHCAFNDMHAMMAFAGAGRWDLARRLLDTQARRVAAGLGASGANYDMTRLVGMPACRAIAAFARGDAAAAGALLRALPPVAHRIGGSHAQRDVLQLTRAAAEAARAPRRRRGEGHASRRLAAA